VRIAIIMRFQCDLGLCRVWVVGWSCASGSGGGGKQSGELLAWGMVLKIPKVAHGIGVAEERSCEIEL
jgi:hypothetical protein